MAKPGNSLGLIWSYRDKIRSSLEIRLGHRSRGHAQSLMSYSSVAFLLAIMLMMCTDADLQRKDFEMMNHDVRPRDLASESEVSSSADVDLQRKDFEMMNHDIRPRGLASEATRSDINNKLLDKTQKRTITAVRKIKDVGKSSILKFFRGSNSSFPTTNQAGETANHDTALPPSFSEKRASTEVSMNKDDRHSQTQNGYDAWGFNVEDIDPSVLDELPIEIQREVREWIRPLKRTNTSRKGSSIVHYFAPVKME